jgi:N4-gp56 family major capsid protein
MALNTNVVATAGLPNAVGIFYDRHLLTRLELNLFFDKFGTKKKLPKNSARDITFTRYNNLAANVTALTDGTVPSGDTLQSTQITARPTQYGNYLALSDMLVLEAIDPIIKGATEVLGYQAGLSADTIMRNALDGNMTNQFAGAAASEITTSAVCNAAEFRKAAKALKVLGVKGIDGGEFGAIIHSGTSYDLQSDSAAGGWLDVNKYTTNSPMLKGEVGKLYGIRFVESPNIKTGTGAASAVTYHNWVFGMEGYGVVEIDSMSLKTYVKQLGSSGVSDPLDQISTVGYKFSHVTKVLDATRGVMVVGTSAV